MSEKIKVPKPEEEKPEKEETPFEKPEETPFKEETDKKEEKDDEDEKGGEKDDEPGEEENLEEKEKIWRKEETASILRQDLKKFLEEEKSAEKIKSFSKILWHLKRLKYKEDLPFLEKVTDNISEIFKNMLEEVKGGKWDKIIYQLNHPLVVWLTRESMGANLKSVGEGLEMLYPNKKEEILKLIGQITTHLADPEKMFTLAIAKKLENLKRALG